MRRLWNIPKYSITALPVVFGYMFDDIKSIYVAIEISLNLTFGVQCDEIRNVVSFITSPIEIVTISGFGISSVNQLLNKQENLCIDLNGRIFWGDDSPLVHVQFSHLVLRNGLRLIVDNTVHAFTEEILEIFSSSSNAAAAGIELNCAVSILDPIEIVGLGSRGRPLVQASLQSDLISVYVSGEVVKVLIPEIKFDVIGKNMRKNIWEFIIKKIISMYAIFSIYFINIFIKHFLWNFSFSNI